MTTLDQVDLVDLVKVRVITISNHSLKTSLFFFSTSRFSIVTPLLIHLPLTTKSSNFLKVKVKAADLVPAVLVVPAVHTMAITKDTMAIKDCVSIYFELLSVSIRNCRHL